jgi:hypothetical protein
LSNIVLADFHQLTRLGGFELFAASFRFQLKDQAEAYDCSPSNPMFGAKRLALNRNTDSVVALTPNIKLVELTGIEPVASWLQTRRSPS